MLLIYFFGFLVFAFTILILIGYSSSPINHAEVSQSFPIPVTQLWDFVRNVDAIASKRKGIKDIEVLREYEGRPIEWILHTTHGGFRVYRIEERVYEQLSKILVSSTFGVTGRWDYRFEKIPGGVKITIEEYTVIPSFWYRSYLLVSGRKLHVTREMHRIEEFVNSIPGVK